MPAASSTAGRPGVRALVHAVGGRRYVVALAVDSIGAGLLRPFLLLYGIDVLHLAAVTAGLAMTAGMKRDAGAPAGGTNARSMSRSWCCSA